MTYIYTHASLPERYLPSWFNSFYAKHLIQHVRTKLFPTKVGLIEHLSTTFTVKIASTERALFELMSLVPNTITYQYAYLTMQSQMFLSVDLIQELLECCNSKLVKRLFLHLAKKCTLPVFERLNLNKVELGNGRRYICKEATVYDPEFKIIVPALEPDGTLDLEG